MNHTIKPSIINTENLVLREGDPSDTYNLFHNYTSDHLCSRFLTRAPHAELAQTEKFIHDWCITPWKKPQGQFSWVIALPDTQEVIGLFIVKMEHNKAEIHYGIGRKFWGKGFATEAGLSVVSWLKDQQYISMIWTVCDTNHLDSINVLQKLGLQNNGLSNQQFKLPAFGNVPHDFFIFSLAI